MRNRIQRILVAVLAVSMAVGMPAAAFASGTIKRLGGSTRYDTMSQIVSEGFTSSDFAVVATGDSFPDALAASALAGAKQCPVILTSGSQLSTQARQLLTKLKVSRVYVIGGSSAISDATYAAVKGVVPNVARVQGTTRIETSVKVLEETRKSDISSSTVIIASGSSFADALSISPYAYMTKSPILLTNGGGELTEAEVKAIKDNGFKKVVVVGGENAVNLNKVKSQLEGISGITFEQLKGSDRYATNHAVNEWVLSLAQGMKRDGAAVATGTNYPDALAGSALCGSKQTILVLTDSWTGANLGDLTKDAYELRGCYILGGEDAVSAGVQSTIQKAMDESEYFERVDEESTKRFPSVKVELLGDKSNKVSMKPSDGKKTLYAGVPIDVIYSKDDGGKTSFVKMANIESITVSASGKSLVVSFDGDSEVLTDYLSNKGVLTINATLVNPPAE